MSNPYTSPLPKPDGSGEWKALVERDERLFPKIEGVSATKDWLALTAAQRAELGDSCFAVACAACALALCRMTAEDWLMAQKEWLEIRRAGSGFVVDVDVQHVGFPEESFPTIDEALALACHMRLDSEQANRAAQEVG